MVAIKPRDIAVLEWKVSVRASEAWMDAFDSKPSDVFIEEHDPPRTGVSNWAATVHLGGGPGSRADTHTYGHASYKACLEALLRRPNILVPSWQERLENRILYLPWSREEAWFRAEDPQAAWDACPDGSHLLWVLGKSRGVDRARLIATCIDLSGDAHDSIPADERLCIVDEVLASIAAGKLDRQRLAELVIPTPRHDDEIPEGNLIDWHYARAVISTAMVVLDQPERAHEVAYHSAYVVLPDYPQRQRTADTVRRHFPVEVFTHEQEAEQDPRP